MSGSAGAPRPLGFVARLALAFACFARIIAGRPLPAALLAAPGQAPRALPTRPPASAGGGAPVAVAGGAAPAAAAPAAGVPVAASASGHAHDGAVALLALLQQSGRFIDFVCEPLDGFSDAQVGAAARGVHQGCAKALRDRLRLEPVLGRGAAAGPGAAAVAYGEAGAVTLEAGFDPAQVRLLGAVRGDPPFRGRLVHPGWRVAALDLPALRPGERVVAPAEVEVTA